MCRRLCKELVRLLNVQEAKTARHALIESDYEAKSLSMCRSGWKVICKVKNYKDMCRIAKTCAKTRKTLQNLSESLNLSGDKNPKSQASLAELTRLDSDVSLWRYPQRRANRDLFHEILQI